MKGVQCKRCLYSVMVPLYFTWRNCDLQSPLTPWQGTGHSPADPTAPLHESGSIVRREGREGGWERGGGGGRPSDEGPTPTFPAPDKVCFRAGSSSWVRPNTWQKQTSGYLVTQYTITHIPGGLSYTVYHRFKLIIWITFLYILYSSSSCFLYLISPQFSPMRTLMSWPTSRESVKLAKALVRLFWKYFHVWVYLNLFCVCMGLVVYHYSVFFLSLCGAN